MNQLQFQLARNSDPESSWRAADDIQPHLEDQCDRVLRFLKMHPATTAKELASYYTARHGKDNDIYPMFHKRLPELRRAGKATNGDMRACRISGRLSQVWSAA